MLHAVSASPSKSPKPATLSDLIVNVIDSAVIALDERSVVLFANDYARLHGMVAGDSLIAPFYDSYVGLRADTSRTLRFRHDDRFWYCRRKRVDPQIFIAFATPEPMREPELVRRFQRTYQLTDRQADMLRQLLRGSGCREAAKRLKIQPRTAARHLAALLEALGVDSVAGVFPLADAIRRAP